MKAYIFTILLILPFLAVSQRPNRQIHIDSKFLTVNPNSADELGFTFTAGLGFATRSNANKEDRVPMPVPRLSIGMESEPLHGLYIHPQISYFQNGSLEIGPNWKSKLKINNIGLNFELQPRILESGPWSYGLIFDPFLSYATCGKDYFEWNGLSDEFDVEFHDGYNRIEGHIGIGLGATVATDLADFTFRTQYNLSFTPIISNVPSVRDRGLQIGVTAKLFKNRDFARNRSDLIIFLKPSLVE